MSSLPIMEERRSSGRWGLLSRPKRFLPLYIVTGSFPINEMKLLLFVIPLLLSRTQRLSPSLGWVVTMMASLAKIATPMLLVGKFVRTLSLRSFRALVMSTRGEILGFPIEPLL